VGLLVALIREEPGHVPPVLEHLEGVLGLPVRRLQHQQHDAQAGVHVPGVQLVGLLQQQHPVAREHIEHLPIGVLSLRELALGLGIDRLVGDYPQHEARAAPQVAPEDP
jgi:hypothetical protein